MKSPDGNSKQPKRKKTAPLSPVRAVPGSGRVGGGNGSDKKKKKKEYYSGSDDDGGDDNGLGEDINGSVVNDDEDTISVAEVSLKELKHMKGKWSSTLF